MRTEIITYYTFDELSGCARKRAVDTARDDVAAQLVDVLSCDMRKSLDEFEDATGVRVRDYNIGYPGTYVQLNFSGIGDKLWPKCAECTEGKLLYRWVEKFADTYLRRRKTYRTKSGKTRTSHILFEYNDCPFTGVCYDEEFLSPIREFFDNYKRGRTSNLAALIKDCFDNWARIAQHELDSCYDDDVVREHIECNNECYDFLEDGTYC